MGTFRIRRTVRAAPQRVWQVVTDWDGYARWLPMTTMRLDPGPSGQGWSFTGLSGIGPLRFADSMVITHWAPPTADGSGELRVRKTGRLLAGWAVVTVQPAPGRGQTRLEWVEDISLRPPPLGRLLAPLVDRVNRAMFGRAVDRMVAEAEAPQHG